MKILCFARAACECGAGRNETGAFERWERQNVKLYWLLERKSWP